MLLTDSDCPCTKSELQVFDGRSIQTVLEQAQWVDVHPLNNVSQGNAPIEFTITSSPDEYIDLNDTMLHLRCKVVKSDGTPYDVGDQKVAPVNNWMHSLFSDVKLVMGNTQIEGGVHMYPYRAYLSNLLLFSGASKREQLVCSGYNKDTAGSMGPIAANTGYVARLNSVIGGKSIDLCGPLWLDMTQQGKYLIPQMDINIKLVRSKAEFHLMSSAAGDSTARVIIEDAVLYVRRVKVSPGTILEHEKQLVQQNALYPIQHTSMSSYTISTGAMSHSREGLFRGHMPKMVIVGMVDNKAFNGDIGSNPFEFKHNDLNHIALYREGVTVPFRPLTPDFDKGLCVREYIAGLVQGMELFNRNESMDISLDDFTKGGYTLFAFNLTPDLSITGHAQPYNEGNLRLEVKFANALTASINVVIMAIFDGKVEITRQRNVLIDYKG